MKPYELGLVLKSNTSENDVNATLEKIKTLIDTQGGSIEKVNVWGKRRLASIIDKQTEGIFTFINFRINPEAIGEMTRVIRLTDTVLRHIIVKEDGKAIRAVQETPAPASSPSEPETTPDNAGEEGVNTET